MADLGREEGGEGKKAVNRAERSRNWRFWKKTKERVLS
jgi:hypothetical protein